MSSLSKLLVTVGAVIVFFAIFGALIAGNSGSSPGFIGVILFFGLVAGLKAVWKKPLKKEDKHQLDKKE